DGAAGERHDQVGGGGRHPHVHAVVVAELRQCHRGGGEVGVHQEIGPPGHPDGPAAQDGSAVEPRQERGQEPRRQRRHRRRCRRGYFSSMVTDSMVTFSVGLPERVPTASMAATTSPPDTTEPNSEYCGGRAAPSGPLMMKNWLPLVFGRALAMAS